MAHVLDNVGIGLPAAGTRRGARRCWRRSAWATADDYPACCPAASASASRWRARCVHEPTVMLLDEPFGALDALTRIEAQRLVESLWHQHGFTAVLVTHDVEEAVLLADRVLVFEDGRIVESIGRCAAPAAPRAARGRPADRPLLRIGARRARAPNVAPARVGEPRRGPGLSRSRQQESRT